MRVLKPEIAKDREEKILRMIIQEYVETRKPVGSELVAQKGSSRRIQRDNQKRDEKAGRRRLFVPAAFFRRQNPHG